MDGHRLSTTTGNLYIGNFGDGVVHKITFNPDGSVKENIKWAQDPDNLKSTDGMTIDQYGNHLCGRPSPPTPSPASPPTAK